MKCRLLGGVCAAALALGVCGTAQAAGPDWAPDVYVSLFGGVSFPQEVNGDFSDGVVTFDYDQDLKTGFLLGGAIGAEVFDNLRLEGEVSYSQWNGDDAVFTDAAATQFPYTTDGDIEAVYLLGNVWYDVPVGWEGISPYIGGGLGVAFVDFDLDQVGPSNGGPSDNKIGFAFQLGAGLRYGLTQHIAFDISYRFRGIVGINNVDDEIGDTFDSLELYSHNVIAGLVIDLDILSGR